jgi:hypothetical protein
MASWNSAKPSIETATPRWSSGEIEQILSTVWAISFALKPFVGIEADRNPQLSK